MPVTTQSWTNLTQRPVFGFQAIVLYMLVATLVIWWVLDRTPVGRYFYSIGSNPEAARLTGIAVDRWVWLSLIASGTLAGTAGVLYSSLVGPSLTFGQSLLLPAFAAVFLGSTQLDPGRPNAWGTIIALYVLGIGVAGLQLRSPVSSGSTTCLTVSRYWQPCLFAVWRQRAAKRARPLNRARPTQPICPRRQRMPTPPRRPGRPRLKGSLDRTSEPPCGSDDRLVRYLPEGRYLRTVAVIVVSEQSAPTSRTVRCVRVRSPGSASRS